MKRSAFSNTIGIKEEFPPSHVTENLRKSIAESEERCNCCEREETTTFNVPVGEEGKDYQYGNFLNAVDALVYYFTAVRECDEMKIADCLELRAKHFREGY